MWGWLVYLGARAKNPKWYIGGGLLLFAGGVIRLVQHGVEGGLITVATGGFIALMGVAGVLGMRGFHGIRPRA